jgi:hypothetical protein
VRKSQQEFLIFHLSLSGKAHKVVLVLVVHALAEAVAVVQARAVDTVVAQAAAVAKSYL